MADPKFHIDQFVLHGPAGVPACYRVVGMQRHKFTNDWTYDIREADGDGELNNVSECMLEPSDHDPAIVACLDKIDSAVQDLKKLSVAVHKALQHIECMQGCHTFAPMARDLAALHGELGEINSMRMWVFQKVTDAASEING